MIARELLTGLILAGGQGRRMQAAASGHVNAAGHGAAAGLLASQSGDAAWSAPALEKGLLELDGMPLVAHARRHLAPYVDKVLVSANTSLDAYAEYGVVVPDDEALGSYSGPLAGIASALRCVATPWLVVLPVDVPSAPVDLIGRLCGAVSVTGPHIAYASTAAGVHPLCMVVHSSLVDSLYDFLLAGERKVQLWQRQNGAVPVLFDDVGDAFFNINTPEDLVLARGR